MKVDSKNQLIKMAQGNINTIKQFGSKNKFHQILEVIIKKASKKDYNRSLSLIENYDLNSEDGEKLYKALYGRYIENRTDNPLYKNNRLIRWAFLSIKDKLMKTADTKDEITDEMADWFEKRTKRHIDLVKKNMNIFAEELSDFDKDELIKRGEEHDKSKYENPERDPYVFISWEYKCKNDDKPFDVSDEMRDKMDKASNIHIKKNSHHPEYHCEKELDLINKKDRDDPPEEMIDSTKMPDIDIVEMVADWMAMSEEKGEDSPIDWAKKNVNVRWEFTEEQEKFIYELIDILAEAKKEKQSFISIKDKLNKQTNFDVSDKNASAITKQSLIDGIKNLKKNPDTYKPIVEYRQAISIKDKIQKTASIVDYPYETLPTNLWDDIGDKEYKLKPEIRDKIIDITEKSLINTFGDIDFFEGIIIGSSLATQFFLDSSDLDIKVLVNESLKEDRDESIKRLRENEYEIMGHPVDWYIYDISEIKDKEFLKKYDSIYDIFQDSWIKKPHLIELDKFPRDEILNRAKQEAIGWCQNADISIGQIKRNTKDFDLIFEHLKLLSSDDVTKFKEEIEKILSDIEREIEELSDKKTELTKERHKGFKVEFEPDFEKFYYSINWTKPNLKFKIVQKWQYLNLIRGLEKLLEDDNKITEDEIPEVKEIIKENKVINKKSQQKYYTTGIPFSFKEFVELEVEDRENYDITEAKEIMEKYNISEDDKVVWVSPHKWVAFRYSLSADDYDKAEEIAEQNPQDVDNVISEVDGSAGFLIPESDDGDEGYLFVFNQEKKIAISIKDKFKYIKAKHYDGGNIELAIEPEEISQLNKKANPDFKSISYDAKGNKIFNRRTVQPFSTNDLVTPGNIALKDFPELLQNTQYLVKDVKPDMVQIAVTESQTLWLPMSFFRKKRKKEFFISIKDRLNKIAQLSATTKDWLENKWMWGEGEVPREVPDDIRKELEPYKPLNSVKLYRGIPHNQIENEQFKKIKSYTYERGMAESIAGTGWYRDEDTPEGIVEKRIVSPDEIILDFTKIPEWEKTYVNEVIVVSSIKDKLNKKANELEKFVPKEKKSFWISIKDKIFKRRN
jgi:hypothetical protein